MPSIPISKKYLICFFLLISFVYSSFASEQGPHLIYENQDSIKIKVNRNKVKKDIKRIISWEYKKFFKKSEQNEDNLIFDFSPEINKELDLIKQKGLKLDGLTRKYIDAPWVTIDNAYSKDLDQAMALKRSSEGHTLLYAIADAYFFLFDDENNPTELQKRASQRIFTTYYPGEDAPILPRELSEDLCSLNPQVERRAFIIKLELNKKGDILSKSFERGVIKSKAQLSYSGVQDFYDSNFKNELAGKDYTETLLLLKELGEILVRKQDAKEVVKFPEGELRIYPDNENEDYYVIQNYKRLDVELWNEQISLISNYAVGEFLAENELSSIHRYLPEAEEHRLDMLREKLKALKHPWSSKKESLGKYVSRLDDTDKTDSICRLLACRATQKASYDPYLSGHEALKLEHYDQFTAPMRRNTDVYNHQILAQFIEENEVSYQGDECNELEKISKRAKFATDREKNIEREINDYFKLLILKNFKGKVIKGHIEFITNKGILVEIYELPIKLYFDNSALSKMMKEKIIKTFDEGLRVKFGKRELKLGQEIEIKINKIDMKKRKLDANILL